MRELQREELENINGGDLKTDAVWGSIGGAAATGATFGITFGPPGILAGAVLGDATGALSGIVQHGIRAKLGLL